MQLLAGVVSGGNAPLEVEYLVVAGGGGGGTGTPYAFGGGAGGAGGYRCSVPGETSGGGAAAEDELAITPGNTYTVTVGGGGSYGVWGGSIATSGSNSVLGSITSTGGGYGSGEQTRVAHRARQAARAAAEAVRTAPERTRADRAQPIKAMQAVMGREAAAEPQAAAVVARLARAGTEARAEPRADRLARAVPRPLRRLQLLARRVASAEVRSAVEPPRVEPRTQVRAAAAVVVRTASLAQEEKVS